MKSPILIFFGFILSISFNTANADQKNNIVKSLPIGQFETNTDYLKSLKILITSSLETKNRIDFIKKMIIPHVKKGIMLDIGIGNGELTRILCDYFTNIHIVDPSLEALQTIKERDFPGKSIKKFHHPIENYNFPLSNYDFVLISHTLYYTKRDTWKTTIQKSFDALKPGGIQLIVLNNGLGRSRLTNSLGGNNVIEIEKLIEECVSIKNASVSVFPFRETFETDSLENALHIASICLYDVNLTAPKELIEKELISTYQHNNRFIIDFCQYFIVLKKN